MPRQSFSWRSARASIAAGLFLLLPLTAVLFLFTHLWHTVHDPVRSLSERMGVEGFLGVNVLLLISFATILLVAFMIGALVRSRGEGRLRHWLEEKVLHHLPGYAYVRIMLEARLGLAEPPSVRPAMLRVGDGWQPVFLVERLNKGRCVVYVPSVPMAASGGVLVVEEANVELLPGSVVDLDHALRHYGKGLGELLDTKPGAAPHA
jgi:uncharacterized membrane protein